MTGIPILNGIRATNRAKLRVSLPINLEPTLIDSGLSKGYLAACPGISQFADGTAYGEDRGGIVWNGLQYRVLGTKLVSVSSAGVVAVLGDVESDGKPVTMDISFDLLGVASNLKLWFWDGGTLTQNTDEDLGDVIDMQWIDGYWQTTDGTSLVVTELTDPLAVDPLKYGSSEADPDSVTGVLKVPGESVALNRYSIEFFRNVGGLGYPFARVTTAQIDKGCIGPHAKCRLGASLAFVGGGKGEGISVYVAGNGTAESLSIAELDEALNALSDADLATVELERRFQEQEERLLVHLPDRTWVFMPDASSKAQQKIWYQIGGGARGEARYPVRHLTLAYGKWVGGDSAGRLGWLDPDVKSHFGEIVGEQFSTLLIYSKASDFILGQTELVGLPGRTPFGTTPKVWMSFTRDGETWSQEFKASMGGPGVRRERVVWWPNVAAGAYLGLRFRTANTAFSGWAALEADIEALG